MLKVGLALRCKELRGKFIQCRESAEQVRISKGARMIKYTICSASNWRSLR